MARAPSARPAPRAPALHAQVLGKQPPPPPLQEVPPAAAAGPRIAGRASACPPPSTPPRLRGGTGPPRPLPAAGRAATRLGRQRGRGSRGGGATEPRPQPQLVRLPDENRLSSPTQPPCAHAGTHNLFFLPVSPVSPHQTTYILTSEHSRGWLSPPPLPHLQGIDTSLAHPVPVTATHTISTPTRFALPNHALGNKSHTIAPHKHRTDTPLTHNYAHSLHKLTLPTPASHTQKCIPGPKSLSDPHTHQQHVSHSNSSF